MLKNTTKYLNCNCLSWLNFEKDLFKPSKPCPPPLLPSEKNTENGNASL